MTTTSYRGLAWIAAIALFMQTLDATILNTALPAISKSLNENPLNMQLAIISYALTVALFIPLTGWIADRFGVQKIFRYSVGIFVLGSICCTLSYSLETLVLSRILQGLGGSLMMPVARLAIIRNVPKNQLLHAWNLMAMAGLIGPVLGPILGGWLVTYTSWHWIFLINIPIGALGILVAGMYMPNHIGSSQPLDWRGFLLFAGGLVGLTLGLDLMADRLTPHITTLIVLATGFLFFALYYRYAKKTENALLPLSLFQIRTFRIGLVANLLIRLCGSGVPFLLPLIFQIVFQYSAEFAGWLLAPIALSSVLSKPIISPLLHKFGYKKLLIIGALGIAMIIIAMSFFHADSPLWFILLVLIAYGSCMSVIFSAINTLTVSELGEKDTSAGATMLSVSQQVGIGIGIAVSAVILAFYRHFNGEVGTQLQQSFSYTFLTLSIFAFILVWLLSYLRKQDGENLRNKK
ncbi:DHA2 family efflux MFS transporter permease subunit [Haemophilus haemoglobinophilus]|nr:DHA2 family efflux MFS transporter permease subunit [Canicola haemoglobinophilus]